MIGEHREEHTQVQLEETGGHAQPAASLSGVSCSTEGCRGRCVWGGNQTAQGLGAMLKSLVLISNETGLIFVFGATGIQ